MRIPLGKGSFPLAVPTLHQTRAEKKQLSRNRVEAETATACPETLVLRKASVLEDYQNSTTGLLFAELDGKDCCYPSELFPPLDGRKQQKMASTAFTKGTALCTTTQESKGINPASSLLLFVFFTFTITMWLSVLLFSEREREKKKKTK